MTFVQIIGRAHYAIVSQRALICQYRRRQHSAVESGINALEVHGLDRCPDHGLHGFKRYVALAVVARNIQKLGAELQQKLRQQEKRKRHRDQLAA